MKPNIKPKLQYTLLSICIANLLLLTACGGGGGGGGMVRNDPPPPVAPPPPPPPPPACQPQLTADCVVTVPATTGVIMTGGRQSDYALIKRQNGWMTLSDGDFRFSGGTVIEGGSFHVSSATLQSNVTVQAPAVFSIGGTVIGNTINYGRTELWGVVTGDLQNHGALAAGSTIYGQSQIKNTIQGNFRQTPGGTYTTTIPLGDFFGLLQVNGRADLDGTLQLNAYDDHWGPYPLPVTPLGAHVLHADGGVFGQFAQWTSPGLFIEGNVRYGSNDVWFDFTRISLQSAMADNAAADPMTLASAANVDAALSRADGFAQAPTASLDAAQRRFLASAASLLYARDVARATRTFDSLSGQAHALAGDVLHAQAAAAIAQLDAHLDRLAPDARPSTWSTPLAHHGRLGGSYTVDGQASGFDQWLGPNWLVGGGVARAQSQMQFERMGGHGRGDSPMASVYAHYRGRDWHATGVVGAGRTVLQLDRPIDLGAAGIHLAHSRRDVGQAFVHGELGRRIALGRGRLTPFVAIDYSALHSDGFSEQGDTGFELIAQSARSGQLAAAAGARYARDWRFAGNGWLRLGLDARYQRRLAHDGDAQQAAFVGVPDALFDLTAWSQAGDVTAINLGLAGGFGGHWMWSADYSRRFGVDVGKGGWFVGLRRDF